MRYDTVLVAIDLSLESEVMLSVARDLVDGEPEKVHVTYVMEPETPSLPIAPYLQGLTDDQSTMIVEAKRRLTEIAERAGIPEDNQRVLIGSPAEAISNEASKLSANLVVIGKHTRTLWGVLYGATGPQVTETVDCDVLTVNIGDKELVGAVEQATNDLIEAMIKTPTKYFKHPDQVGRYPGLDTSRRIKILKSWKHEIVALMKATEENLGKANGYELADINDALEKERINS